MAVSNAFYERAAEREKKKQKRALKRASGESMGPSRKMLKRVTMESSLCKVRVAVDCSYDHLMTDKWVNELSRQLQYCYSANRRAPQPLQYYVTGVSGKIRSRLEEVGHYKNWDVHFTCDELSGVFNKEEVVYLSSDSDNMLETLDPAQVYVIGGLVDHNHHKGLCHRLAEERGWKHAALPISSYLHMNSRKVLTVNHVFEILLHFTQSHDWKEAFLTVIPQRKGAEEKLAPSDGLREAPTDEPVEGPSNETVEAPSDEPVQGPSNETVEAPSDETVEAPSDETVEAPSDETVEAPNNETVEAPRDEPVGIPSDGPVEKTDELEGSIIESPQCVTDKCAVAVPCVRNSTQLAPPGHNAPREHCEENHIVL